MSYQFSTTQKKASLLVIGLLMVSAVAATQYAGADVEYSFGVTGSDSGIRFVGHDLGVDAIYRLRADNTNGDNIRLELGDWGRGQSVTYTGAFGIVNENIYGINITSVSVTGAGNVHLYLWLHDNANTKATSDPNAKLVFNDGNGPQTFYWPLAAGNGDASDANNIATPTDSTSNTRVLASDDNAVASDHVCVQIKLEITQTASNGKFTVAISVIFEESKGQLTLPSPACVWAWEEGTSREITRVSREATLER